MKRAFPTTKIPEGNTLEVEVYYDLGGHNYFTGDQVPRGYYLSVSPVELGDGWRRYTSFSGKKKFLLEDAKRKSGKRLTALWTSIEPKAEAIARAFEDGNYRTIVELAQQPDGEAAPGGEGDNA